jgi:uncharacterized protein (TIGR00106 family)
MLVQFTIYPMDGTHMSKDVAQIIEILDAAAVDYRLGPMATAVEGSWEKILPAIQRCHDAMREKHPRVITTITIDDRKEHPHHLNEMVSVVEERLGHVAKQIPQTQFVRDF